MATSPRTAGRDKQATRMPRASGAAGNPSRAPLSPSSASAGLRFGRCLPHGGNHVDGCGRGHRVTEVRKGGLVYGRVGS